MTENTNYSSAVLEYLCFWYTAFPCFEDNIVFYAKLHKFDDFSYYCLCFDSGYSLLITLTTLLFTRGYSFGTKVAHFEN